MGNTWWRQLSAARRVCATIMVMCMAVGTTPLGAESLPTVRHRPIQYFVPGYRVEVLASVSDESGVDTVRCYFRQKGAVEYSYVDMSPVGGDQYRGVLPAPESENNEIEYLFLLVTGARCVFRSNPFVLGAGNERQQAGEPPRWQQVSEDEPLQVGTDLETTLAGIPGFDDAVALAAAAPEERYGVTGELYGTAGDTEDRPGGAAAGLGPADVVFCGVVPVSIGLLATLSSGGGASGAGAAGAAGAGGIGVGAVAAGVGVAAAVGGGVAAAGGGGGGGGSPAFDPGPGTLCAQEFFEVISQPTDVVSATTPVQATGIPVDQVVVRVAAVLSFDAMGCEPNTDTFGVLYQGAPLFQPVSTCTTGSASGGALGSADFVVVTYEHGDTLFDATGYQWSVNVDFFCDPVPQAPPAQ